MLRNLTYKQNFKTKQNFKIISRNEYTYYCIPYKSQPRVNCIWLIYICMYMCITQILYIFIMCTCIENYIIVICNPIILF